MTSLLKRKRCLLMVSVAFLLIVSGFVPVQAQEKPAAAAQTDVKPTVPAPSPAPAEEEKPTGELSVSGLTAYIWRGYENTRNSVVIQPSLTVGYKGFSANIWGNLDTQPYSQTNVTNSSAWTETDYTLSYTKTIGIVNAGVGYIYYGLGAANAGAAKPVDSQEVYVTAGLNTLLSPTLTAYKEIDHYHQYYFLLGVSHTVEFNKTVSLKVGASASYLLSDYADATQYNIKATNDKFSNFHDGVVTVSLPINLVKYITVAPTVSYSFPLSGDANNEIKARGKKANPADNDSSFVYGGLTFDISF
jgi:hypothetical protein